MQIKKKRRLFPPFDDANSHFQECWRYKTERRNTIKEIVVVDIVVNIAANFFIVVVVVVVVVVVLLLLL